MRQSRRDHLLRLSSKPLRGGALPFQTDIYKVSFAVVTVVFQNFQIHSRAECLSLFLQHLGLPLCSWTGWNVDPRR